jgi:toxin FitB
VSLVVLDTDVASFSLRNRLPDQLRAALAGHTMCITFVTVGELMKWRVLRSWGPSRTDELARWRERVGVLAYDEAVRRNGANSRPARNDADGPARKMTPG